MKKMMRGITFKSLSTIVLLLLVFAVIVCLIGFDGFTDAILEQYSDSSFRTARICASLIDPDDMDRYAASGGVTEEYQTLYNRLDRICNATGSTFVYIIRPDTTDYGHITFIFSLMNREMHYQHYPFGYVRQTTNDDYRRKYRALYEGEMDEALVLRDTGYIETDPHITAMVPLRGADGQTQGILCVQSQMDVVVKARMRFLREVFIALVVVTLIVTTLQGLYMSRTLLQPLQMISTEARRFAAENLRPEKRLTEKITNTDEIGMLAGSIDRMEDQICDYVDRMKTVTAREERISTELNLARRIQADMLPSTFPAFPHRKEFDIYATMEPAKEVGGDFYDFFLVDEDHLCLVIADVSGKGVPAALFMMASKIMLADNVMTGKSPAEVLEITNNIVCATNREEMFVTVWLGILEISTGIVRAANAGHEYPVLKKPGGDFELLMDKHGLVIGGMEGVKYKEYEFQMEKGSVLFVYTDGLPEATDASEKMFGVEGMMETLNNNLDAGPQEILALMKKAADDFAAGAPQFDDVTMLCVCLKEDVDVTG